MKSYFFSAFLICILAAGCASTPPVKTQAYAKLPDSRTFEYPFPTVWKGIESALRNQKITDRSPGDVDELEMRKLTERTLETDWVYGQSRDKYVEYKVNGSPRKTYLQTRFRYKLKAWSQLGGTSVKVSVDEEIERLKNDGTPGGYESVASVDTSRTNELLDRIQNAILSAAP